MWSVCADAAGKSPKRTNKPKHKTYLAEITPPKDH